jgi:hypothetical protein
MTKPKWRLSLDWLSVFTALIIATLVKAQILKYIPW